MDFLFEYGLFLAEVVTVVIAVIVLLSVAVGLSQKNRVSTKPMLKVNRLNDDFEEHKDVLNMNLLSKAEYKALCKQQEAEEKAREKKEKIAAKAAQKANKSETEPAPDEDRKKRLFVIDFHGDIKASAVDDLARCVTAVLMVAKAEQDEVVVRLESPGGLVHTYGLAAAQLQRVRAHGLTLTVLVDRVAASGGYMMACVANKIVASPFAVVGSIGVVAQIPNFHRVLKKHEVDLELHTAGEYKRTLTLFGKNTEEGRQKFISELEDTHTLFKEHIEAFRPKLNINEVATGEHWFGKRAKALQLIDEIMTSDDYLLNASKDVDILEISFEARKTMADKLAHILGQCSSSLLSRTGFGRQMFGREGVTAVASSAALHQHEWVRAQIADSDSAVLPHAEQDDARIF